MDPNSLIEASAPVRQKAAKAYEELQQTNANGKWKATAASIDQHQAPEWFKDAKFGMFIDWGPWSIAGWAPKKKGQMIPDWYEMHSFLEPGNTNRKITQDYTTAESVAVLTSGKATIRTKAYVAALQNLLVVRIRPGGDVHPRPHHTLELMPADPADFGKYFDAIVIAPKKRYPT